MAAQNRKPAGITRKLFWALLGVSFFALTYINFTSDENLRLVAEQYPEVSLSFRKAFLDGYKMFMSLALFLTDIVLVGPFAWLSYFGDHIVSKCGDFIKRVSFFDLGIMLAIDFTMAVISFNFMIINAVDPNPIKVLGTMTPWIFTGIGFAAWFATSLLKIYSYSSDQRKDLKKYVIKF